ncbi:hypothetical protein CPU12_07215 [Malaciobacter molluscorum LMG 25693]|uniref:Uncharacterized protein n=1 Tax=Malaciobacter molluscorum LMG 25693 TaxID=870501 RepID=A0A2G1DHT5_9BACT|nr:NifB/NifX family molybdenum-iron cluster-binding protein [Malaciobacter molluscorum]AXX92990.1 hypothetical protein AMOL_2036 [Malaciobacter molluscorum LMG 25693]PHO18047.1 hypothetical protein CPU12_07215 [Malaciobacter molluscorum LMG 25693]RXJ94896.1 hypothetical protein CRV00_06055 [Malaciobacter molluscorum]
MRIVFPTIENLSYLSNVAPDVKEANFFTVLNLTGQTISSVELMENRIHENVEDEIVKLFKSNNFNVLIVPHIDEQLEKKLKKVGISIFTEEKRKKVLGLYSDFVQDKLTKI